MTRDRISEHDPLVGTRLGGYLIARRIGAGATGVVYEAAFSPDDHPVAIKVLSRQHGQISALQRRFEREARALAKLNHPNVVHISDFGVDQETAFIAMEMLVGETLEDVLQRAPIDPLRAVGVMLQAMRGLAFAHENGIVHRDLKPANIFLRQVAGGIDVVKVLDFGLAKFLEVPDHPKDATLTRKGRIVGTPAYMAPEQITGGQLDARADVYAAGIVLYEMLADQRPFSHERRSQLLRAHLFEAVPRIQRLRPGLWVHADLERIILRALEKHPSQRFADGGDMLRALEALPAEPASFESQRIDSIRSRTGSTGAVVISESERDAVTSRANEMEGAPSKNTPPSFDASVTSDRPLPAPPAKLASPADGRGLDRSVRAPGGTTSSHPRPGKLRHSQNKPSGATPSWLWAVAVAALMAFAGIYWFIQWRSGALP